MNSIILVILALLAITALIVVIILDAYRQMKPKSMSEIMEKYPDLSIDEIRRCLFSNQNHVDFF